MTTIPTLDFAAFLKDEGAIIGKEPTVEQARVASQINDACKDHGFVFIRNLGLPDGLREKTFEASRGLFALDDQYKRDNLCRSNPETNAGYAPFGSESTNKSRPADLKEAFNTRLPALGLTDFSGTPEGYKETATSFWAALEVAMDRYAIAIATALGLPFDYFKGKLQKKNLCTLRMLHYPPCDPPSTDPNSLESIRIGEHTDFGLFTFLFLASGAQGLQIKPVAGGEVGGVAGGEASGWVDVPSPESDDTVVVNTGALLARWTNDTWRATAHRVIVPDAAAAAVHRYSIACFCDPDGESIVSVHSKFVADGEEPRYPPITGLEYLLMKLNEMQIKKP